MSRKVEKMMVLECQEDDETEIQNVDRILKAAMKNEKQVILISKKLVKLNEKYTNMTSYTQIDWNLDFQNLTEASQGYLMDKNITFYDKLMPIYKILLGNHYDSKQPISSQLKSFNLNSLSLERVFYDEFEIKKPKVISDLSSSYSKFYKKIDRRQIPDIFMDRKNSDSILVVDGQGINSIEKLIDVLNICENEEIIGN